MNIVTNTPQVQHHEVDLDMLFQQQAEAQAVYELALTYKSFGFRDKAITEFYRLCEQRTESAEHCASKLAPLLFN